VYDEKTAAEPLILVVLFGEVDGCPLLMLSAARRRRVFL
jgi:hypothetical protein